MFVLYRGSSFILMDTSGSSWMFSVIYINMSIKPEICGNAKAQKWEGNNLYEYMVIYIQTLTVLTLSNALHNKMQPQLSQQGSYHSNRPTYGPLEYQ